MSWEIVLLILFGFTLLGFFLFVASENLLKKRDVWCVLIPCAFATLIFVACVFGAFTHGVGKVTKDKGSGRLLTGVVYETVGVIKHDKKFMVLLHLKGKNKELKTYWLDEKPPKFFVKIRNGEYVPYPNTQP